MVVGFFKKIKIAKLQDATNYGFKRLKLHKIVAIEFYGNEKFTWCSLDIYSPSRTLWDILYYIEKLQS